MIRTLVLIAAAASLRADSLEEILRRMDASAKTFDSVSAKIKQTSYNELLKETSESPGQMRLKKTKKGIVGIYDFSPPDVRTYHIDGGTVEIYYPNNNSVDIYDLSKYKKTVDSGLTLGFGTSGTEIQQEYQVKVLGTETVQSTPTTHLELIPKSKEVLKLIPQIELWIQNGKYPYPVQVKQIQSSKDYSMVVYSDVKINPRLPASDFELKLPAGVKKHKAN